jgi:VCBS repeat protein
LVSVDQTNARVFTLFGNGDGSFREGSAYTAAFQPGTAAIAHMNGDGNLDLVVGDYGYYLASVSVLLENGDGTFRPYTDYDAGPFGFSAIADFNNDGRLDLAVTNGGLGTINILTQDNGSTASLSAKTLTFPTQLVNTVSDPQIISLTNTGTTAIKVSNISMSPNFSELTNCGTIQPGHTCKIGVFFTPTIPGNITGYMAVTDKREAARSC